MTDEAKADFKAFLDQLVQNQLIPKPDQPDNVLAADTLNARPAAIEAVEGRYRLVLDENRNCSLRITANPPFLSADFFRKREEDGQYFLLGGHPDWRYSVFGPIENMTVDKGVTTVVVTCDLSADRPLPANGNRPRAFVRLRIANDKLTFMGMTIYPEMQSAFTPWETRDIPDKEDHFREIEVDVQVDQPLVGDADLQAHLALFFNDRELSLSSGLSAMGIKAHVTRTNMDRPLDGAFLRDVKPDPIPETPQSFRSENPDWKHTIFLTNLPLREEDVGHICDHEADVTIGTAFGLGEHQHRFRSRYAAAVNVDRTILLSEGRGPRGLEGVKRQAWMLRSTCLHELGHLFNLPHPWQRLLAHQLLGPSTPAGLTVMHYPFSYPFGPTGKMIDLADADEEAVAQAFNDALLRMERASIPMLTPKEHLFLRHAPLNHIAQGGHSFLDHMIPPPKITKRVRKGEKRLDIVVQNGLTNGVVAIKKMDLFAFKRTRFSEATRNLELPVLPCMIKFSDDGTTIPLDNEELMSGSLQVFVRVLYHNQHDDPYNRNDRTIAYPMDMSRDLSRFVFQLQKKIAPSAFPTDPFAGAVQVPWLKWDKMRLFFKDLPLKELLLQAVYYLEGTLYRSTPVELTFIDEGRLFKTVDFKGSNAEFFSDDQDHFIVGVDEVQHVRCTTLDDEEIRIAAREKDGFGAISPVQFIRAFDRKSRDDFLSLINTRENTQ